MVTDVVVVLPTPITQDTKGMNAAFLQLCFSVLFCFGGDFARAPRLFAHSLTSCSSALELALCFQLLLYCCGVLLMCCGRKEGRKAGFGLAVYWWSWSLSSSFFRLKMVSVWRVDNSFPSSLEELWKIWKSWELLWDENQERRRRKKKKNKTNRRRKSYDLCSCSYTCRRVVGRDGRGSVLFCCCGALHSRDAACFL